MSPRAPFPDQKDRSDVDRELNGVFRVKHADDPQLPTTYESPGLNSLTCCHTRPLRWLWPDKIPLGKLTLIEGPPAVGKLYLALDIAARVSTAEPWPDEPLVVPVSGGDGAESSEALPPEPVPPIPFSFPVLKEGVVFPVEHRGGEEYPQTRADRDSLLYARMEGLMDEPDPLAVRYVPPADYVPPPPAPLPSGCVPPDAPREATPVVIVCDEWEAEDMIGPRLETLGANPKHIGFFTEVWTTDSQGGQKRTRPIGFPLDLMMFQYIIREHRGCRMIIIDNLDQYCTTPKQMREAIRLLDQAAIYHTIAIVATVQRNVKVSKQGELRDTSRREDGIARCIWCVTPDPSHPGLMRLEPKRMAFCKKPQGIAFRITDAGRVAWEPLPPYQRPPTAAALRKAAHHQRALVWLTGMIGSGVVHSEILYDEGKQEGFSRKKLIDCRMELGARSFKVGFAKKKAAWLWTLKPASEVTPDDIDSALTGEPGTSVPGCVRATNHHAPQPWECSEERGGKSEERGARNGENSGTLNGNGRENGHSEASSGDALHSPSIRDLDPATMRKLVETIMREAEPEELAIRHALRMGTQPERRRHRNGNGQHTEKNGNS